MSHAGVVASPADVAREYTRDIKKLSELAWGSRIDLPGIDRWLQNFTGAALGSVEEEHLVALHLLKNFTYFGVKETRVLLRSMFRDLVRYPLVQEVRKRNNNTLDMHLIESEVDVEIRNTRFLAMGNPSESGAHLLYYFRQVNELPKTLFINQNEIVDGPFSFETTRFSDPNLKRLIFVDDLLGSGSQATEYSKTLLSDIAKVRERTGQRVSLEYMVLFAKLDGLEAVSDLLFDRVKAVHTMNPSELAFSAVSRIYANAADRKRAQAFAQHYGRRLCGPDALGFSDGQLLLGFEHNVPDNTLPIFWWDEKNPAWDAIFPRFRKVYQ